MFMKRNFLPQFFDCIRKISQNHITSLIEFLPLSYSSGNSILFDMKITQPVASSRIINFEKASQICKVVKILHLNTQAWMLNVACTHGSAVLVVLHYYMLRNRQSQSHLSIIQHDVGGCVMCISNKAEYPDNERSYKNSTKEAKLLN